MGRRCIVYAHEHAFLESLNEADCQVSSDGASQYGKNWLTSERGISPHEFTRWFVVEITNNEERAWIYQPRSLHCVVVLPPGRIRFFKNPLAPQEKKLTRAERRCLKKMKNRTTAHYVTRESVAIISQISARYGKMRTKKRTEQRKEV